MRTIHDFINFLNAKASANTSAAQASQPPTPATGQTTTGPTPQSAPSGGSPSTAQGCHHTERQKMAFQQARPTDIIESEEQQWQQNSNGFENDTLTTRVITADGQVAAPSELQSVCTQCQRMVDTVIRSDISHVTLCRTCQRRFRLPEGRELVCTAQEFMQLTYRFDTWASHDFNRKRGKNESP